MDFDELSLSDLRQRRSAKWSVYPPDVLPAWVAEMDFPLAAPVKAALADAVARDDCGYASSVGLTEAFAAYADARLGWRVDPARVRVAPDVMTGVAEVLRVLTEPGDGVVINPPVYPPFAATVRQVERQLVEVPLVRAATGWELDLDGLEAAFVAGARAYLLCNPHNPTGGVFAREELLRVAALADRYGVVVLADEIHAPLTLPGAVHTPYVSLGEEAAGTAVTLASASKGWNIAGLKCGLIVAGSEKMTKRLEAIPPELAYHAGHFGVLASIAAFRDGGSWLDELLLHLDRNRELLGSLVEDALPGVGYVAPDAGYLAWLDCTALDFGDDPAAVFLERGRVALSSGPDFGREGAGFARLNMGTSRSLLTEAVSRMATAMSASAHWTDRHRPSAPSDPRQRTGRGSVDPRST